MKEIIALQEYTDKYISLYEGQIRNIEDNIANKLIEKGIVAEHSDSGSGGGGSSAQGAFITEALFNQTLPAGSEYRLDKTYQEIEDAFLSGQKVILKIGESYNSIILIDSSSDDNYQVGYYETYLSTVDVYRSNNKSDYPTHIYRDD